MVVRGEWLALWPTVLALVVASASGCTGKPALNDVRGKVLYQDQPLNGVLLTFHPKDEQDLSVTPPTGLTNEDGTFFLTTGEQQGALAGEYIVTFICSEEVAPAKGKAMAMAMGPEYVDRFKGAYAEKSGSKFQVSIKPGVNQLEPFSLK